MIGSSERDSTDLYVDTNTRVYDSGGMTRDDGAAASITNMKRSMPVATKERKKYGCKRSLN
jgi:hypothetical protein